ncbi:MAG: hypothetical protein AAF533_16610 [Acidobacteriota bacterium]
MSSPRIIGLTGPNAAGKGAVGEYLSRRHDLPLHSLSDVIRREAAARGQEPGREVMIALGNELRAAGGPGALAQGLLPHLVPPAVVDSIRTPAEVEVLRAQAGFELWLVTAPVELRFERSRARDRVGDATDLETFRRLEEAEDGTDAHRQQLSATAALADRTLTNDGDLARLEAQVEDLLTLPPVR